MTEAITTTTTSASIASMLHTEDEDTAERLAERIQQLMDLAKWFAKDGKRIIRKLPRKRGGGGGAPSSTPRRNSAVSLQKPVPLCDSIALFMGLEPGASAPRPEVTKFITAYIREHELQIEGNRKSFTLDESLAAAFGVAAGTVSNYFHIQKLLNTVIYKVPKSATGAAATEDTTTQTETGAGETGAGETGAGETGAGEAGAIAMSAPKATTKKAAKKKSVAAAAPLSSWADAKDDDGDHVDGSGGGGGLCDDDEMSQLARDLDDGDEDADLEPPPSLMQPKARKMTVKAAPKRMLKGVADLVN